MSPSPRVGVLLLAHGAPTRLEDLPRYAASLFGGRSVSAEVLEDMRERYRRIGASPLVPVTLAQGRALARRLNRSAGGSDFEVVVGMRHSEPTLESALAALSGGAVSRAVVVPMTPYSACRAPYVEEVSRLGGASFAHRLLELRVDESGLAAVFASRVRAALARLPEGPRREARVLFCAHSLPVFTAGYAEEFSRAASAVARAAGASSWSLAYQSRGRHGNDWLGPGVDDALRKLAADGERAVVLAPIGFLAENLETLYDCDLLHAETARSLGLAFSRAKAPDADPDLVETLAGLVEALA